MTTRKKARLGNRKPRTRPEPTPPRIRFEVRTTTSSVGTIAWLCVDGFNRCTLRLSHDEADALRHRLEGQDDTKRLEWLCRYVRDALDSGEGLHRMTLLLGDAPPDCNCREAACPHERQFPPTIEDFRAALDAADSPTPTPSMVEAELIAARDEHRVTVAHAIDVLLKDDEARDGENFTTHRVECGDEVYSVTVQREGGLTPSDVIEQLRATPSTPVVEALVTSVESNLYEALVAASAEIVRQFDAVGDDYPEDWTDLLPALVLARAALALARPPSGEKS